MLFRSVSFLPPTAMDPASEELERRSRYLSSLIRRTKLSAAPAPAPAPLPPATPTPPPEPETTKLELELERERSPNRRTKLNAAPAPPPSTPHPEPETKLELEPRSRKLVEAKAVVEKREVQEGDEKGRAKGKEERKVLVRVRAADMPVALQRCAIRLAYDAVAATPRVDGKRLALALKKVRHPPHLAIKPSSISLLLLW